MKFSLMWNFEENIVECKFKEKERIQFLLRSSVRGGTPSFSNTNSYPTTSNFQGKNHRRSAKAKNKPWYESFRYWLGTGARQTSKNPNASLASHRTRHHARLPPHDHGTARNEALRCAPYMCKPSPRNGQQSEACSQYASTALPKSLPEELRFRLWTSKEPETTLR
ncbi:hypothetical protein P154DRAFT_74879 [Amniculicola lignicola CBS 123094]|uniref:Uncharacterized protein n=1 Tax=Amniculicola lignicola CBS 123094 TaxID=1392246 RepID=A0A6A5W6Y7_9PLEO|nr:hypothetical protein P154DRAFT_74879 [Amniculicola lignicola CBS 123094]